MITLVIRFTVSHGNIRKKSWLDFNSKRHCSNFNWKYCVTLSQLYKFNNVNSSRAGCTQSTHSDYIHSISASYQDSSFVSILYKNYAPETCLHVRNQNIYFWTAGRICSLYRCAVTTIQYLNILIVRVCCIFVQNFGKSSRIPAESNNFFLLELSKEL